MQLYNTEVIKIKLYLNVSEKMCKILIKNNQLNEKMSVFCVYVIKFKSKLITQVIHQLLLLKRYKKIGTQNIINRNLVVKINKKEKFL